MVFQMVWQRKPPSTLMSAPVTKPLALPLARKIAAPTNSAASPKRPIGVWFQICRVRSVGEPSGLNKSARFWSAGKKPGVRVLTRTPWGAHSRARKRDKLSTPAFEAH